MMVGRVRIGRNALIESRNEAIVRDGHSSLDYGGSIKAGELASQRALPDGEIGGRCS